MTILHDGSGRRIQIWSVCLGTPGLEILKFEKILDLWKAELKKVDNKYPQTFIDWF